MDSANEKYNERWTWISEAITPIACKYGLKRVYLFGSYAKGTADKNSDVDLLIEKGRPMSLITFSEMRQDCVESLGCEVDLLTTAGIEKDFFDEISGSEVLLYESQGFHNS